MERSSAQGEIWRKYIRGLLDVGVYGVREARAPKGLIIGRFGVHACHAPTPGIPPKTHLAEFKRTNYPFSPSYLIVTKIQRT
tara:strand:+ start:797 stop:1042 length:246 start_codon:yes stop_codon:yes gene_type:complete